MPAYNEQQRLPATLESVLSHLHSASYSGEIVVVDDGSSDGTVGAVEALAGAHPELRLIRNPHRGKAFTVRTGILASRGQHALFMDADGATHVSEVDKLLALLEQGYDVAIGSREGLGAQRFDEPSYRHLMGRVFNLVVRTLAVPGIQDTQCGFKAFRHQAAQALFSNLQLYAKDTGPVEGAVVTAFDVEILFLARKWGYAIAEVPVHWRYGEESKVNPLKDSWRNFRDVIRVRWNDLRGRYPNHPPTSSPH